MEEDVNSLTFLVVVSDRWEIIGVLVVENVRATPNQPISSRNMWTSARRRIMMIIMV
jgi:hypothetical protein